MPYFSYSMKKALEKPRKYYAYDIGLQAAVSKSFSEDTGRRAENAVAIELIRRGKEVQYYSNDYEVDFVVKDGLKITVINVCTGEKLPARENASLAQFSKDHRNAETLLLNGMEKIAQWL